MDSEKLLLEQWATVERIIAFTCRKHRLFGADAEDFASVVKVKLFENELAIVRQFRGDSSIATYLGVVVQRIFIDVCVQEHGKWRPSAEAKRNGPVATELERMVQWDGLTPDEAIQRATLAHPELQRSEIASLAEHVPQKQRRRSTVALDDCMCQLLAATEEADVLLVDHERQKISERAAGALRTHLATLTDEDRVLLQLQFEAGMQIAEIARMLRVEQKPLYRRRQLLLRDLREALMRSGIEARDIIDLIGHLTDSEDYGLRNRAKRPSKNNESAVAGKEASK
jgi:RNA polymerase sigma factor (sigma-70 family)